MQNKANADILCRIQVFFIKKKTNIFLKIGYFFFQFHRTRPFLVRTGIELHSIYKIPEFEYFFLEQNFTFRNHVY